MTKLLEEAIRRVSQMPESMQDHIGAAMLEKLDSDLAWEEALVRPESLRLLDNWASEALADLREGRTKSLDLGEM